ncbi:uncharacterized protein Hap1MRO34_006011 isoform 2-T2 [Clarias gariepinus]
MRNRFAPLRETAHDALVIGDSIVRHVRATTAKGSTTQMACTLAELEQRSFQTTSPGHYEPSDWRHLEIVPASVDKGQPCEDPEASREGPAPAEFCLIMVGATHPAPVLPVIQIPSALCIY